MDYNNDMDQNLHSQTGTSADSTDKQNRRELVTKLGKFAVYAAPFTIMAINSKAATSSGPGPHAAKAAPRK
jgi:hypothetical protein